MGAAFANSFIFRFPMSNDPGPPEAGKTPPAPRNTVATLLIILCVAMMFVSARYFRPGFNYLSVMACMVVMLGTLGVTIMGSPFGVLVTDQNVMSLSRFQMAGWTIVVIAAYFTFAITRLVAGIPDPLNVGIDWHLWALLGISTTSLVGSSLILGMKKDKDPEDKAVNKAQTLTKDNRVEENRQGTLYVNPSASDARFTDMFQGDELGDTTHIDLAKVQMFLFSVIAIFAFAVMVTFKLRHLPTADRGALESALQALPLLSDGLVAVLGISHAGYLTNKTADHTQLKKP